MRKKFALTSIFVFSLSTWAQHSAGQNLGTSTSSEQFAAPMSLVPADKASKLTCLDFRPKGTYRMEIHFKKQATLTSDAGKDSRFLVKGESVEALEKTASEFKNAHCEMNYHPNKTGSSKRAKIVPPGAVVAPNLPLTRFNSVSDKNSKITKGCGFDFTPKQAPTAKGIKPDEWGLKCFVESLHEGEPTLGELMQLMKDFAEIKVYRNESVQK